MLLAGHRSACGIILGHHRSLFTRQLASPLPVRAAAKDDHSTNKRPDLPRNSSVWDEHLSSQDMQADKYRPPAYERQEMQASRGKFLGRLAVLILGAVLLSERVTGKGAVQQLEISAVGVPLWEIEPVLGIIVLALTVAALWPSFLKQDQAQTKVGFLERIQRLSGRFACLGLASTITAEVVTGKGALALLNVETGLETVSEIEAIGAFVVMLLLTEDIHKDSKQ